MKRSLQPHLVGDDWLGLHLLHADWLVEDGALVQGELSVQGRADLEGGRRGGAHVGQHLRLAEGPGEGVAPGPGEALQVGQGEGAGPQVGGGGLGGHAVQGWFGGHHVRRLAALHALGFHRVAIAL